MTSHLLAAINAVPHRRRKQSAMPDLSQVAIAAAAIEERWGGGGSSDKPPPSFDLLEVWKRLNAADAAGDYEAINPKDWRYSPWCLWFKVGEAIPLVQRPTFFKRFSLWIKDTESKIAYGRLVQAWVLDFDSENPSRPVVTLIRNACAQWPEWFWAKRDRAFELFDVKQGPALLAARVLDDERSVSDVLQECGLGEWLQTGGYVNAAYALMLRDLPRRLRTSVSATRTQQWIERVIAWSLRDEKELRFPTHSKALAETLLLPWVSRDPSDQIKNLITKFLIHPNTLGDPRFGSGKKKWRDVNPEATKVLVRWRNLATHEALWDIIQESVKHDAVAKAHVKARRAFWMAYQAAGHISDVWIALGPEAEKMALDIADLHGQFGRLTKQIARIQSVLLLQIGNLLIVVWSHNGSCRIWTTRSASTLRFALYESEYWGDELRSPADLRKPQQGDWQRVIHDFIYDETGITVSDYYP